MKSESKKDFDNIVEYLRVTESTDSFKIDHPNLKIAFHLYHDIRAGHGSCIPEVFENIKNQIKNPKLTIHYVGADTDYEYEENNDGSYKDFESFFLYSLFNAGLIVTIIIEMFPLLYNKYSPIKYPPPSFPS